MRINWMKINWMTINWMTIYWKAINWICQMPNSTCRSILPRRREGVWQCCVAVCVMNCWIWFCPPPLFIRWISNFLKDRMVHAFTKGTTSCDVTINQGVPQGSRVSPLLYLNFTNHLYNTPKVFRLIFSNYLKYFVAVPNLSIVTTKL